MRKMFLVWIAMFLLPGLADIPKTLPPISQKELSAASDEVAKLISAGLKALSENSKTLDQVAAASVALCERKDISNPTRYLLLKGAFEMYIESGNQDKASSVIRLMDRTYAFARSDICMALQGHKVDFLFKNRDYTHGEIALSAVFGMNEKVLSNTNRFPVVKQRIFKIDLPKPFAGMRSAQVCFDEHSSRMELREIRMKRILPEGSTDEDLLKGYSMAVKCVSDALGVDIVCRGLSDPWEWGWSFRIHSAITVHLHDHKISIRANDAAYTLRRGRYIETSPASVEVQINMEPGLEDLTMKEGVESREIPFGCDCSGELSELIRGEAGLATKIDQDLSEVNRNIRLAEEGSVRAMLFLARAYWLGRGVNCDPVLEFKYRKMAVDHGDESEGNFRCLADCYLTGRGVEKDVKKALELYFQGAIKGHAWAMARYAKCLAEGIGTEKKPKEAVKWCLMAAEDGRTAAKMQMALYALTGFGMDKDPALAERWLRDVEKDAEKDVEKDADCFGTFAIHLQGDYFMDWCSGMEEEQGKKKLCDMCRLVAKRECWWGYELMARCYFDGLGVEEDYAKAKEYVLLAKDKAGSNSKILQELDKLLKTIQARRDGSATNSVKNTQAENDNGKVIASSP